MMSPSASPSDAGVRLYLYDTSNGWCAQAQSSTQALHAAAGNGPDSVDAAWTLVTNVMALQAQGRPQPLDSGLQLSPDATGMCLQYLASTLTFKKVSEAYGRTPGHWLVVMYRFEKVDPILRPAFLMHPAKLLTRSEVASWVAQAVEHDRSAPGSEVHRLVFTGKGPKLSPLLR